MAIVPFFWAELASGEGKEYPGSRKHSYPDRKWDDSPEGPVRVLTDLHLEAGQIYSAGLMDCRSLHLAVSRCRPCGRYSR